MLISAQILSTLVRLAELPNNDSQNIMGMKPQKDETKPCGKHFSLPGHSEKKMIAFAYKQVLPKHDTAIAHINNLYHAFHNK